MDEDRLAPVGLGVLAGQAGGLHRDRRPRLGDCPARLRHVEIGDLGRTPDIDELLRQGTVRDGDLVIITKGDRTGVEGQTNIMKIMRVGEHALLTKD